jgi:excisionase family DNA binding protein
MTDKKDPDDMLNSNEAGRIIGVSGRTMIRLMETGKLPGYKIGGVWKFRRGDVEAYRESQRYKPSSPNSDDEIEVYLGCVSKKVA